MLLDNELRFFHHKQKGLAQRRNAAGRAYTADQLGDEYALSTEYLVQLVSTKVILDGFGTKHVTG